MKHIFKLITLLLIAGCSTDEVEDLNDTREPDPVLTVTNTARISTTPFEKPRETIVYNDNLYAINESSTYKYDFNLGEWELLDADGIGVANYPYLDYNVSFIRDNKWYILNGNALLAFDFSTNEWTSIQQFGGNVISAPIGVYLNGSIYVFSDRSDKVYTYDFESNALTEHSSFESRLNYGQLVKSVFKVGEDYYFTKLSDYDKITIYKWVENFTDFELIGEYEASSYIAQGSGFVFDDNIIFGLGGETSGDQNGNLTDYELNDQFYYFNTTSGQFEEVDRRFYEGRFVSLPIHYNNEFYLLGGRTISDDEIVENATLDKVDFEFLVD